MKKVLLLMSMFLLVSVAVYSAEVPNVRQYSTTIKMTSGVVKAVNVTFINATVGNYIGYQDTNEVNTDPGTTRIMVVASATSITVSPNLGDGFVFRNGIYLNTTQIPSTTKVFVQTLFE